ncbi:hypothetical protein K469DRAFT_805519 [Zopfia rhizophila CBS 207.26]|uniref:Ecp2 effector protein domain-containing protein n=1 Tax=Zopfia rhizophila CBS 207.26 TaxID=1314779 RepID=A0A6A6ELA2_9PEZI|nr:hypothetical protein K469DRAFT_805519 [Zopfia rhizophila CBS 207.26]
MLFPILLASGLVASTNASPISNADLVSRAPKKVGRTDIYIGATAVMTGDQDPYWTYHQAYDLCGKSGCNEGGANKQYKVKAPISGGLNMQAGEGTITVSAEGAYSNVDQWDWKERNGLIEALSNAAKAAAKEKKVLIQHGPGCSAKQEFCNKEPKMTENTYWEAPSWMKAVILDEDGNHMGDMEISVDFKAERWDPLGIFSCDNAVGAVMTAMDAFERTSPYGAALGFIGDIVCKATSG